jgi:hypothetical protein
LTHRQRVPRQVLPLQLGLLRPQRRHGPGGALQGVRDSDSNELLDFFTTQPGTHNSALSYRPGDTIVVELAPQRWGALQNYLANQIPIIGRRAASTLAGDLLGGFGTRPRRAARRNGPS